MIFYREGHALCSRFQNIYTFSDCSRTGRATHTAEMHSLEQNLWTQLANLPKEYISKGWSQAIVAGDNIFITGYAVKGIIKYSPELNQYVMINYEGNNSEFKVLLQARHHLYLLRETTISKLDFDGCTLGVYRHSVKFWGIEGDPVYYSGKVYFTSFGSDILSLNLKHKRL
jgi:hypothetical protein